MGLFEQTKQQLKTVATTVTNAVKGCTCGNGGGMQGGCHCDFLDPKSPTTADFQHGPDRG